MKWRITILKTAASPDLVKVVFLQGWQSVGCKKQLAEIGCKNPDFTFCCESSKGSTLRSLNSFSAKQQVTELCCYN
jgi:hypothetical protein